MYIQKPLAETDVGLLHDFIRDNSFGTLILASKNGVEANHIPFELVETTNGQGLLKGHVSLKNPVWEMAISAGEVLVTFTGKMVF